MQIIVGDQIYNIIKLLPLVISQRRYIETQISSNKHVTDIMFTTSESSDHSNKLGIYIEKQFTRTRTYSVCVYIYMFIFKRQIY